MFRGDFFENCIFAWLVAYTAGSSDCLFIGSRADRHARIFSLVQKIHRVETFRCGLSSFYNYNVRQAARPGRHFSVTFTSTSAAIFVYWKKSNSTDTVAVPKGEIFWIHFSELKKFRVDESIFVNSKTFRVDESVFLNTKRWLATEVIFILISKFIKFYPWEEEKNFLLRPFYWTVRLCSHGKNSLHRHCWLFGLLIYWLGSARNCWNFFICAQNSSSRNVSG